MTAQEMSALADRKDSNALEHCQLPPTEVGGLQELSKEVSALLPRLKSRVSAPKYHEQAVILEIAAMHRQIRRLREC